MKVLIAIDESPYSQAILRWVKQANWPRGSRFIVLSAVPVQFPAYSMMEVGAMSAMEEVREEQTKSHQDLTASAERDLQAAGLATEGRVESGDARDVIVRTAESVGADLVVVGSHGRTGLPRLLMGSVAAHVVTHAPCTVVVVKQPRAASPRA